jgi:phosphatidylserine decarboxylase
MPAQPILYRDRATRELKTERIHGEPWLRLAYENPAGRFLVWLLIRRRFFSRWYGWKMNRRISAMQILPFIARYDLDVDEFAKSAFDYKTFNEFFYRALKPGCRPVAPGESVAVLPGDGRHLAYPDIGAANGFYVKGSLFTLDELFAEEGLPPEQRTASARFSGGAMLISRLCPVDYHRFHFPVAGVPAQSRLCRGSLYSVSPVALRRNVRYLVRNKRMVTLIDSPVFGSVAMIEVGATNVGSIWQTFEPDRPARKGGEKGFFAFGGSCVITLFGRGRIVFDADLTASSAEGIETYAHMGESLGRAAG